MYFLFGSPLRFKLRQPATSTHSLEVSNWSRWRASSAHWRRRPITTVSNFQYMEDKITYPDRRGKRRKDSHIVLYRIPNSFKSTTPNRHPHPKDVRHVPFIQILILGSPRRSPWSTRESRNAIDRGKGLWNPGLIQIRIPPNWTLLSSGSFWLG